MASNINSTSLIIVGVGLTGAVVANEFASRSQRVLMLEKRSHLGGNVYDETKNDILVHKYGPHIFHTSDDEVATYMNRFWKLNNFQNQVKVEVKGKIVDLPFNFMGIDTFWGPKAPLIKATLLSIYRPNERVSIIDLLKHPNSLIKEVAEFVYANVFLNYTTKMWGMKPSEIDESVLRRVPLIIGYQTRYFNDKYEGLPEDGYTKTISKMVKSDFITIKYNTKAQDVLELKDKQVYYEGKPFQGKVLLTCPLDEFFGYDLGILPYRSLAFSWKTYAEDFVLPKAVLNLPSHPTITRQTEYKHMTHQVCPGKTVLSAETPGAFDPLSEQFSEAYYPLPNDSARKAYEAYAARLRVFPQVFVGGRLGLYQYLNMDQTIAKALNLVKMMINDQKESN